MKNKKMFIVVLLLVCIGFGQTNVDNNLVGHWAMSENVGTISFYANHTFEVSTTKRRSGIWQTYSFNNVPFVQLRYYSDSPRENFGVAVIDLNTLYFQGVESRIEFYLYRL